MEQRSLRLGDIVDDYCPRERRVTNHAIVAIVGDSIRQTRCATCDAEHEYKDGRAPRKRVGKAGESDAAGGVLVTPRIAAGNGQAPEAPAGLSASPADSSSPDNQSQPAPDGAGNAEPRDADGNREGGQPPVEGWLAHRPLIRATLPRVEGEAPPPRAIPEFTMHQRHGRGFGGRGGGYRQGFSGFSGNGNGDAPAGRGGDGNDPDGNRAQRPGKGRHRRRHRRR